ncbi:unnamed protein product, partial [Larinioides sclopetarius]
QSPQPQFELVYFLPQGTSKHSATIGLNRLFRLWDGIEIFARVEWENSMTTWLIELAAGEYNMRMLKLVER